MLILSLLTGFVLNFATVMMHVGAVSIVLPRVRAYAAWADAGPRPFSPAMIIAASICCLLVLQLISAFAWSVLYYALHLADDFEAAVYLALTTISALGGDDAGVHSQWRVLLPLASINGALLIGLSTAVMFRLVTIFHIADQRSGSKR